MNNSHAGSLSRSTSSPTKQENGFCSLPLFELPLALAVPAKSKWKSAEQFLESLKVADETKVKGKVLMLPPKHAMTRYFQEGLKQRGIGMDRLATTQTVHDTQYAFTGLTAGQTLKVFVTAGNDAGLSDPSETVEIVVQ